MLLPDAPEKGVAAMGLGRGGGMVVTMLTSVDLAVAAPLGPVLLLRLKVLLGCSLSWSIRPCFIASSICTPISCRSEKVGKGSTIIFCISFIWRLCSIILIWSLSVGLRGIIEAFTLHRVTKSEKLSLGSCLVVSRSQVVISI